MCELNSGDSPSGKAVGSGPTTGGSNPSSPANLKQLSTVEVCLIVLR